MLVKTFHGKSATEALSRVRAELGDEACVLETRRGPRGVEVLAAAERPGTVLNRPVNAPDFSGSPAAERLRDDLMAQGFSQPLAEQVAAAAQANLDPERLDDRVGALSYARELVALWVPTTPAGPTRGAKTLVVVGSPGVGKTTTLAKLAARELYSGERRVVLATADQRRLGGAEQLEAYARILGVPFFLVRDRRDLDLARDKAGSRGALFLDTPGIPRNDRVAMDYLAELLAGLQRDEIELLLAADRDSESLADTVRRFSRLRPGALCATRADETVRPGALITAVARAGLPLRHVGFGPDIPDDLVTAETRMVAAWAVPLPGETPVSFREETQ